MPIEQFTGESHPPTGPEAGSLPGASPVPLLPHAVDEATSVHRPGRYPGWVRIIIFIGGGGLVWIAVLYGLLARIGGWLR